MWWYSACIDRASRELECTLERKLRSCLRDKLFQEAKEREDAAKNRADSWQELINHGHHYAQSELHDVDGLDLTERFRIERLINSELETVRGDESLADIEDLVESILDEEGIGWDGAPVTMKMSTGYLASLAEGKASEWVSIVFPNTEGSGISTSHGCPERRRPHKRGKNSSGVKARRVRLMR
ncbi:MAG: hypothetical protein WAW96_01050 [Alphaproteobacteria bacterium]